MFKIFYFLLLDAAFIIPLIVYWDEFGGGLLPYIGAIAFFTYELIYNIWEKFKR